MKFSSLAVLAVVAPMAAGFTTSANQRQFAPKNVAFVSSSASASSTRRGAMSMDLSDLEKRLFDENPKPLKKTPAPKPERRAPSKKVEPVPEPAPTPTPAPAPAPVKAAKKVPVKAVKVGDYDLTGVDAAAPKKVKAPPAERPKKIKIERPKVERSLPSFKPKAPKAPKAPQAPVSKDPNALPAGVALGAAPLILAPVALLAAGRGVLSGTKARREQIQKDIAAVEAAKQKKKFLADTDGGEVTKALVRIALRLERRFVWCRRWSSSLTPSFFFRFRVSWELLLPRLRSS
jgi:hypothetical protein